MKLSHARPLYRIMLPGGLTDEGKEDILLGVTPSRIPGEGEDNLHSLELVTYWES